MQYNYKFRSANMLNKILIANSLHRRSDEHWDNWIYVTEVAPGNP